MNEKLCAFFSNMALALLLINLAMLTVVERGSAEQVVTVLSVIMMAGLFALSTAMLRSICKKGGESAQIKKKRRIDNENQN